MGRRLSKSRKFQHSGVEEHGETIFVTTEDVSYEHAVQSWLAEETNYEGEKFGEGDAVRYARFSKHASFLHHNVHARPVPDRFAAQCVWQNSSHFGIAKVSFVSCLLHFFLCSADVIPGYLKA